MAGQRTFLNWCAAALICGLSACQQVSQSVQTQPTSTPAQANLGSVFEQSDEPDIVGDLIAQVEDQEITTDQRAGGCRHPAGRAFAGRSGPQPAG